MAMAMPMVLAMDVAMAGVGELVVAMEMAMEMARVMEMDVYVDGAMAMEVGMVMEMATAMVMEMVKDKIYGNNIIRKE
jgi:hypothetical protein